MIFRNLFSWALGLLPVFEMNQEAITGVQNALQWAHFANSYLPIDTFIFCLGIYLTCWVTCAVISAVLQLL